VNLRQSEGPKGTISVPLGAKDALVALDDLLGHPGR
jgi:hypothetical protein